MQHDELLEYTYYRGRVAMHAILKALKIGRGDEVATQAFTCLAVPEGIMATGARPCYIDISADGYTLDADDLKRKIGPQTRAIIIQHTFGIPADMEPILAVAGEHGVPVIEDCCHTLDSTYRGEAVGTFGTAAFYSFEWGKPIVAGIGGSAVIRETLLRRSIEAAYTSLGKPGAISQVKLELQYLAFRVLYRPKLYWPVRSLFHRLAKLGAAEGNYNQVDQENVPRDFSLVMVPRFRQRLATELGRVAQHTRHSRWVVEQYQLGIDDEHVSHPRLPSQSDAVYARYPLRVPAKVELLAKARERGVEVADWYNAPIHPLRTEESRQVQYEKESCPNAELRSQEIISLPTHQRVNQRYIDKATDFLTKAA